jgi:uncharacterized protein DUF4230
MPTLLEERPATRDPEITVRVVGESTHYAGGGGGGRVTPGNVLSAAGLGAIAIAILLVVGAITGLVHISNPFKTTTKDNSPPVVLQQLRNLSDYNAAEGVFTVDVNVHDDVAILPDFLAGGKTHFRGVGSVPATINFNDLATDAVEMNAERTAVTITLVAPKLGDVALDLDQSGVLSRDIGVFDHIAQLFKDEPGYEHELYVKAEKKIAKAARASHVVERAKQNTESMLKGFLSQLGFTQVTVNWTEPAPKAAATK